MSGDMTADAIPYNDFDDYSKGREAIVFFHNAMTRMYPDKYNISLNELLLGLTKRNGQKFFLEGLGLGIISAEMSLKQVSEAMTQLATQSKGKIPATNGAFKNALIGVASIGSFIDAVTFVSVETTKDLITGTAKVGDKILSTGEGVLDSASSIASNLKWILPIVFIGGAFIYVFNTSKR